VDHMTPRDAAKRPQRRDMELCTAPAKRGSVPPSSEEVCMFFHVVKPQSSRVVGKQGGGEEVSCSLAPATAAREILCDGSTV
jgi:hypothetical protein